MHYGLIHATNKLVNPKHPKLAGTYNEQPEGKFYWTKFCENLNKKLGVGDIPRLSDPGGGSLSALKNQVSHSKKKLVNHYPRSAGSPARSVTFWTQFLDQKEVYMGHLYALFGSIYSAKSFSLFLF